MEIYETLSFIPDISIHAEITMDLLKGTWGQVSRVRAQNSIEAQLNR